MTVSKPQRQTILNFRKCTSDSGTFCGQLLSPSQRHSYQHCWKCFSRYIPELHLPFSWQHLSCDQLLCATPSQVLLWLCFLMQHWASRRTRVYQALSTRPCTFILCSESHARFNATEAKWSALPSFMKFWSSSVLTMHSSPMQSDIFIFKLWLTEPQLSKKTSNKGSPRTDAQGAVLVTTLMCSTAHCCLFFHQFPIHSSTNSHLLYLS